MKIVPQNVEMYLMPSSGKGRLRHIERCGRVCYKSEDKISDGSAEKFVHALINRGHESVLEHAWIAVEIDKHEATDTIRAILHDFESGNRQYIRCTMSAKGAVLSGNARTWRALITVLKHEPLILSHSFAALVRDNPDLFEATEAERGVGYTSAEIDPRDLRREERMIHEAFTLKFVCDRGISHEIVRHRPVSYSQESTRYCNYGQEKFGNEITVIEPFDANSWTPGIRADWEEAVSASERAYMRMLSAGISPQNARDVLPTCLKTELVMTATCDEWLHFLKLRESEAAHPKIRALATRVRSILNDADPYIF